jgi:hypothetical protein
MTGCYLTTLPRAFMRGIADFDPEWISSYFLPRETIQPPVALLSQVWPDLDRWQAAHQGRPDAVDLVEPNLAAGGFLELLQRLRSVFLQDSVLWRAEFPGHPIFQTPLFISPEYKAFERQVKAALAVTIEQDPYAIAIQKAIPAVNDRLRTMMGVIQNGQASHTQRLHVLEASQAQRLHSLEGLITHTTDQLAHMLQDYFGGAFTTQFIPRSQLLAPESRPVPQGYYMPSMPVPLPVTGSAQAQPLPVPQYHMSRTIQTIPELWREWTSGLQGQPSIQKLDELYGAGWRSGPRSGSERQFYSRRKALITEIQRLAAAIGSSAGQDPYEVVVAQLEDERLRAKMSLSKVIDRLKGA